MTEQNAFDFMWYSYFDITHKDVIEDTEKALEKCIQRAYLDLCRTIDYKYSVEKLKEESEATRNDFNKEKEKFLDKEKECIKNQVEKLLDANDFDDNHIYACNGIIKCCDDYSNIFNKVLTYGQAQKWLNMTLKYMWIIGGENRKKVEPILDKLHVPLDNYIFKALSNAEICGDVRSFYKGGFIHKSNDQYEICYDQKKELTEYIKYKRGINRCVWSNIDNYEIYKAIQELIKKDLETSNNKTNRFTWEFNIWLKIASKDNCDSEME